MAQNDFLPFAIAVGADVLDQTDYSTLPALSTGFQSGLASSKQINKAIRQATVMAAVLGQWIADTTGNDVLDNGDTSALVSYLGQAVGNISSAHIASASGSADAITATFSPAITLSNGMVVYVRAAYSNATTTPTFNPDDLGALPIVKGSNLPLAVGDIGGAGYWMILQYDQAFNKWVLQNPATGIGITANTLNAQGVRTVVDSYVSQNNWWRKWSDGWLEQGGVITASSSSSFQNLPIPFGDTNYFIVANMAYSSNVDTRGVVSSSPYSTTAFYIDARSVAITGSLQEIPCNFYACGQGA